jgi:DNA-binding transcriptional regulator PaaX
MIINKRSVTVEEVLRFLDDVVEEYSDFSRKKANLRMRGQFKEFNLNDYFPSAVDKVVGRLLRAGIVEKLETSEGLKIKLTEKGRRKVLFVRLNDLKPKTGAWDGKWRMVFFDVEEHKRLKRDKLRQYLTKLGLKQMQRSVWIGPYEVGDEIKYIREVLGVPHEIKLGLLEKIENDNELKEWFGLK